MTDSVRIFGAFLYGLCCALLALACEYAGQAALHVGRGLMHAAERLTDYALEAMPEDPAGDDPFQ
jgi:hypothetical protein